MEKSIEAVKRWRQQNCGGMNKIVSGLWVGSLRDAMDAERLREHNITAIVSVHDFTHDIAIPANIATMRIKLSDSPEQDAMRYFSEVISFIHPFRMNGESVLVHCLAGVSRSVCIVVAYLMTVIPNLGYSAALAYVQSKRPFAQPNFGFRMQLRKFEEDALNVERNRLFSQFGNQKKKFLQLQQQDSNETASFHSTSK